MSGNGEAGRLIRNGILTGRNEPGEGERTGTDKNGQIKKDPEHSAEPMSGATERMSTSALLKGRWSTVAVLRRDCAGTNPGGSFTEGRGNESPMVG